MKRFFYLAVAFASLISFASCKDDDEDEKEGKLVFEYKMSDKTACVVGVENTQAKSVKIPLTTKRIDGEDYLVTSIGDNAFSRCLELETIEIPNSINKIGRGAFASTSLLGVVLPNSVTEIGESAFSGCYKLIDIEIPNSVTKIGRFTFSECVNLTSIKIPSSVTEIGSWAFSKCKSIKSINIPNSVTIIGNNAFEDCTSLTKADIPQSVTEIGDYAFWGCQNIKIMYVPKDCKIGDMALHTIIGALGEIKYY